MGTDPYQLYVSIAQISTAFAGFGSVASGLGRRQGSDDARIDAHRLAMMLFASLSATLLGLLPATLALVSRDEQLSLRLSAIAALLALCVHIPITARRTLRLRDAEGFSLPGTIANGMCVLIAVGAFALCALGVFADRLSAIYLVGLTSMLASSVIMFSRLIASMLRPHRAN